MPNHWHNKVVLITGASSGIGAAAARRFAEVGAQVVLASRAESRLRQVASAHPDRMHVLPADITRDDDVQRLFDETRQRFARLDVLVNNAGLGMRATVEELTLADAQRVMDINFTGLIRCTKAALPWMRQQGHGQIVNVGSILSLIATPRNSIYSASKFAVKAFSDALRIELRGTGIDVILILPGYTDTPFFDNMIGTSGPTRITSMKGQSPDVVARVIVRACEKRKREVVLTAPAKLGAFAKRIAPRFIDWVLAQRNR